MSGLIRQSIGVRKSTLLKLIDNANQVELVPIPIDPDAKANNVKEITKLIARLETTIEGLEKSDSQWIDLVSRMDDPKSEELQYEKTASAPDGYLVAVNEATVMVKILSEKRSTLQASLNDSTSASANGPHTLSQNEPMAGSSRSIKVPKLQLPTFSGDVYEWNQFWTVFKAAIHHCDFSGVQKFSYLRSYLKGAALDAIDGIQVSNDTYDIAVSVLISRFERSPKQLVAGLYSQLKRLPSSDEKLSNLQRTFDQCTKIFRQLENTGEEIDSNQSLVLDFLSKFPEVVLKEICRRQGIDTESKLSQVQDAVKCFISETDTIQELLDDIQPFNNSSKDKKPGSRSSSDRRFFQQHNDSTFDRFHQETSALNVTEGQSNAINPKNPCYFCSGLHFNSACDKYDTVDKRKKRLDALNRCTRCLRFNHKADTCRTQVDKVRCYICRSSGDHTSPLCPSRSKPSGDGSTGSALGSAAKSSPKSNEVYSEVCSLSVEERSILATAVTFVSNPTTGAKRKIRIIFDNGSHRSYITERLSSDLDLAQHHQETLNVSVFGLNRSLSIKTHQVHVQIELRTGGLKNIVAHTTPFITKRDAHTAVLAEATQGFIDNFHLKLADDFITTGPPDILIGSDYFWEFLDGNVHRTDDDVYLIPTSLGVVLGGRFRSQTSDIEDHSALMCLAERTAVPSIKTGLSFMASETRDFTVSPDIDEFWSLETIGISECPVVSDDEVALKQFEDSVYFENGRYQVSWPWKERKCNLPTNYHLAIARLRSLLKRMCATKDDLSFEYNKQIQNQINLGIVEEVEDEGSIKTSHVTHYLPHHPVVRLAHQTTKVRIVYDASAKCSKNSASLNDCLYRGPVILPDLCSILIRFRLCKIAIISDIEKAFLQISLQPSERDVTRFIWLKDPSNLRVENNLRILRFTRVPFGIVSSPFLLAATVRHHLESVGTSLAKRISDNIYVDNVITGVDSDDAAVAFYEEAKTIFSCAGMNLREWSSNSTSLLQSIPENDRTSSKIAKVLGLMWNVRSDSLTLQPTWEQHKECSTKRSVLKAVASVYDPLGLFQPCTLAAKIFFARIMGIECRMG